LDTNRRREIEALMGKDGGRAYWGDPAVQKEYTEVLARLAGEAPPLSPQAPTEKTLGPLRSTLPSGR
jgi:hypothetical protein